MCVCCDLQQNYRKDLELEVKGKGLTSLEETPDLLRVKNAGQVLSEVQLKIFQVKLALRGLRT